MLNCSISFRSLPLAVSAVCRRLRLCLLSLLLFAACPLFADVNIKFDDLKEGDKISDISIIVVRADSSDGIDKVEFAVDDQLKFTTGSTPYIYKWDTIPETEGKHVLSVTAIDSNGVKKTVVLNLTIDNALDTGVEALAAISSEALKKNDKIRAVNYSRRALKADPTNIVAARALSAVLASRLDYDKAISTLSKAKNLEMSVEALLELSSYRVKRAFLPEFVASVYKELEIVYSLRKQAADLNILQLKSKNAAPTDIDAKVQLGDTYFSAGRYKDAQSEYGAIAYKTDANFPVLNRLALSYIMDHREDEAIKILRTGLRDKTADAAAKATVGLALLRQKKFAEAKALTAEDGGKGNAACLLVASFADAALGKRELAFREALKAQETLGELGEVHYALSMSVPKLAESEQETVQAIALSPLHSGPYLAYANQYVLDKHKDNYVVGIAFGNFVLKFDPNNDSAKFFQTLVFLQSKRIPEAETYLSELLKKEPKAPDFQLAAAAYFEILEKSTASSERFEIAKRLYPEFASNILPFKPMEIVREMLIRRRYRSEFFLTPASLYPPKTAAREK